MQLYNKYNNDKKQINNNYFLYITHLQPIFTSYFKLVLNSVNDLLDLIVLGS